MTGWLYDKKGRPCVYLFVDRFIGKNGRNLGGLINNRDVYSLEGKHIGWFEDDVLFDADSCILGFQREAFVHLPFIPYIVEPTCNPCIPARPDQPEFEGVPARAGFCGGWSDLTVDEFFWLISLPS